MRHGKKVNHLGRKAAHRRSMLANMACSLIEHKRINTTVAKAKALKQFIEPLITKSKAENNLSAEKGTHNRRIVFKNLRDKGAVSELFSTVAEKVGDRPGGYTRIIKLGSRLGDNADMAMIELVDFNELYNAGKPKKKKSTRRGGGKKSDQAGEAAPAEVKAKAKEAPKAEPKADAGDEKVAVAETKVAEPVEEAAVTPEAEAQETQAQNVSEDEEDTKKKESKTDDSKE